MKTKVCVMTANYQCDGGFIGVVVGATLEEVKRKARKRWYWYESKDPLTIYYSGNPTIEIRWHKITGRIGLNYGE